MKGDPQVIEVLNDVLTSELTAINQYFIHHKMCENWGYLRLSKQKRGESIDEMKHADSVIERILFFDGVPTRSISRSKSTRSNGSTTELRCAERRATTAPASCSKGSCRGKKRGRTGWKPSSTSSTRSAKRTISPNRSETDWISRPLALTLLRPFEFRPRSWNHGR